MIGKIQKILDENYSDCKKTITELSYDGDNRQSLCDLTKMFFGYDFIVKQLSNESLCSPDVIHTKNGKVIFVEFKNGCVKDAKEKMRLKLKGVEGGFICLYEVLSKHDKTITFEDIVKLPKEYIVVYNGQKDKSRTGRIVSHLTALTEIRFGLDKYKGTFFNNIQTVSEDVFMQKLISNL